MSNAAIKVLLSGAGGAGTIEIIRMLKKTGCYRIIGIDASPYAFGLKLADVGFVVPLAIDPEFKKVLEWILAQEQPDYIIPLVDEEILVFHDLAKQFNMKVVAPNITFCKIALDKWLTYKALQEVNIPTPKGWLGNNHSLSEIEYPAVIKPRFGRGSRGLAYLQSDGDLMRYLKGAPDPPKAYIIQKHIEGREFTVSVVVGLDGSVLAVVPKEVIIKRGITLVGVTRHVPQIEDLCIRIQEELQANGPFNVQIIVDEKGNPYVIEINPRYSTTVALTIAAGVNEVDLVIRHDRGEKIQKPIKYTPDLMMIRYYTHHYITESRWPFSKFMPLSIEEEMNDGD